MSIESTVSSLLDAVKAYGVGANDTAQAAISELKDLDIPLPSAFQVTINPLEDPVFIMPPTPGSIEGLGEAPDIPELGDVDSPDEPDLPGYELGELLEIVIPDVPVVEFPTLDLAEPIYEIDSPDLWEITTGDINVRETPFDTIRAKLLSNVLTGGTGLSATVEDAIWARELEKNEQQLEDSMDKIRSTWAKMGFTLPDGLLANSLSELQRDYASKQIDRAREIAIEQAKLEQTNIFKSIEFGISLWGTLIELLIKHEDLLVRVQESTAKFANEYIRLQMETYASLVEAFKATAQVHETLVRASLAKVEVFKTQIEGQKAIGDVNEQTIKVYAEQIRSNTALIQAYTAEVEAMVAKLNVEKAKVEANKLQMDAWATKANVLIAEYNGKVDVYRAGGQVAISEAEVRSKNAEATLQSAIAAAGISAKSLESYDRIALAGANVRMEAAKGIAAAASTLAAGALAALATGADMSYKETKTVTD